MPYSGTLVTRVFTSRGQLPVQDAFISVVQHQSDGDHLLDVQTSNRSGNTTPVTIVSPSPQSSQSPNESTPFALCDIWVEHKGYQLLVVRNVQIFPDIISVQNLPLIPLAVSNGDSVDTVIITPQDL